MTRSVDDPADAFAVLGDETRLAILRALADADEPLPFSRLRERAGVRDSGRFSYHLRRLCEYFVRETDEGYELGHTGSRVVAATAAAGGESSAASAATGPVESDECPVCGAEDCEKLFHVHLSPPWREG
ncbi:ArsR/SmtB family transcription factor [Halosimplex salinum]|uniref:ArsR/SmtB family transcription factor n=1 Tax=Halosimplex salinum TaxID=1710538 RepID=UPI000F470206|nr:helix-turn-helix domain-containing protein [Halosimplex salinum]